jgi:putative SOS response-associated peptidase YedK
MLISDLSLTRNARGFLSRLDFEATKLRRCPMPTDGFYEWLRSGATQPGDSDVFRAPIGFAPCHRNDVARFGLRPDSAAIITQPTSDPATEVSTEVYG